MVLSLASVTKAKEDLPPRISLLGVEKIGKTTFASEFDSPIFLPIKGEEGIDAIEVSKFPTIKTYSELLEAIGVLYNEDHHFKFVVIDSITTLEPLIWDRTCDDLGVDSIEKPGYGKGYIEAMKWWRQLMDGLDALRNDKKMGCILIGHVKVKTFNDPDADPYDTYQLDLQERAANALYRWSDSILFAKRKVYTKEVKTKGDNKTTHGISKSDEPMLYTRKRPAHPGGGRGVYGQLPYELPLNYQAFCNAISQAKELSSNG